MFVPISRYMPWLGKRIVWYDMLACSSHIKLCHSWISAALAALDSSLPKHSFQNPLASSCKLIG